MTEPHPFEWKIRPEGDEWKVIDYNGNSHTFPDELQARQFIERDKAMISAHAKQVYEEMGGDEGMFSESSKDEGKQAEEHGKEAGFTYNRADRRRVERLAGRQPSSRRGRISKRKR